MTISAKLNKFLSQNKVKFEEIKHRQVFTGLDKAATLRVKPGLIAKTLVMRSGKDLAMAILAANRNLNKKKFAKYIIPYQCTSKPISEKATGSKFQV